MFNSMYLDVVMALVVVFALLSIVASSANEWLAHILQLRGKLLRDAILNMFDGSTGSFGIQLLSNPLIQSGSMGSKLPSYLEATIFSGAVMDSLQQIKPVAADGTPPVATGTAVAINAIQHAPSKQALGALWQRAENTAQRMNDDVHKAENTLSNFDHELQSWFNATMDRVSGVYKRKTQIILFAIGIIVAVGLNVDTIYMTNTFVKVQGVREVVVASAAKVPAPVVNDSTGAAGFGALSMLAGLQIPMGWGAGGPVCPQCVDYLGWTSRIGGWLLTAIAISCGAPFWFDLLGKFTNLRAAGTKPVTS